MQGVQHYVIKFVSDLRLFGGFLRDLRFPSPVNTNYIIFGSTQLGVQPTTFHA
jgi:hypothetical protein